MDAYYWIGQDGNVYVKNDDGSATNLGKPLRNYEGGGVDAELGSVQGTQIVDPALGYDSGGGGGGGTTATTTVDPDIAIRAALRNEIAARGGEVDSVYGSLFSDLDNLLRARDAELTTQYGTQRAKAGEQFTEALPAIDQSYAALGSYDSTQRGDSRGKAKKGFEDTTETIKQNEQADKGKLGQYGNEQRAKFTADKESAQRNVSRAGSTEDVAALRGMRNDLETNLSTAAVTRATLGTEGKARKDLESLTKNEGRYEAAISALDSILKSSMASDVKAAAVQAVTDSAGLSDEEKKKVQETYGNVYEEQAALQEGKMGLFTGIGDFFRGAFGEDDEERKRRKQREAQEAAARKAASKPRLQVTSPTKQPTLRVEQPKAQPTLTVTKPTQLFQTKVTTAPPKNLRVNDKVIPNTTSTTPATQPKPVKKDDMLQNMADIASLPGRSILRVATGIPQGVSGLFDLASDVY